MLEIAEIVGYIVGAVVFGFLLAKLFFARSYEKKNGTSMSKEIFRKYWIIMSCVVGVIAVLGLVLGWT